MPTTTFNTQTAIENQQTRRELHAEALMIHEALRTEDAKFLADFSEYEIAERISAMYDEATRLTMDNFTFALLLRADEFNSERMG